MAHNGDINRSSAGQHSNHDQHHHHHADIPPSPSHFGFTGAFLAEDLQELLGAIREEHEVATAGAFPGSFSANSVASVSNSLSHEPNNNHDNGATSSLPGDCAKAQARSERKRSRERQRRSDVNKQFSDLTELLRKIEAEDQASEAGNSEGGATNRPCSSASSSRFTFSPANRVDLIAKTITVLERMHATNQKRKRTVVELQEELERTKKAGEDAAARLKQVGTMYSVGGSNNNNKIMMMVPMMVSSDASGGAPTATAFSMPHPFMQHASFCPMPPQQQPGAGDSASATNQPRNQSSTNPQNGMASAAAAASSSMAHAAYPHHQHHASYPSYVSMVPAATANTAPAPYIFHPGMAQAAMPAMAFPDQMAANHGMHPNQSYQVPLGANHQFAPNNTINDQSSLTSSPDASAQQESKVASSGPLSTGGNLAHCA